MVLIQQEMFVILLAFTGWGAPGWGLDIQLSHSIL